MSLIIKRGHKQCILLDKFHILVPKNADSFDLSSRKRVKTGWEFPQNLQETEKALLTEHRSVSAGICVENSITFLELIGFYFFYEFFRERAYRIQRSQVVQYGEINRNFGPAVNRPLKSIAADLTNVI